MLKVCRTVGGLCSDAEHYSFSKSLILLDVPPQTTCLPTCMNYTSEENLERRSETFRNHTMPKTRLALQENWYENADLQELDTDLHSLNFSVKQGWMLYHIGSRGAFLSFLS